MPGNHEIAEAQRNLGACYAEGEGVERDAVQAYMWLKITLGQGTKDAAKVRSYLESLEKSMTGERIEKALRLSQAFEPSAMRQGK